MVIVMLLLEIYRGRGFLVLNGVCVLGRVEMGGDGGIVWLRIWRLLIVGVFLWGFFCNVFFGGENFCC